MTITIKPVMFQGRAGYKATLVASTSKVFNWHVYASDFAAIETQALTYEESENGA